MRFFRIWKYAKPADSYACSDIFNLYIVIRRWRIWMHFEHGSCCEAFLVDKIGSGHRGPFIWIVNVAQNLPLVTTKSFISRSKPILVSFFYEFTSADYANALWTALFFWQNWYFQIFPTIECKFRNWAWLFRENFQCLLLYGWIVFLYFFLNF